jgi:hypothetical protein
VGLPDSFERVSVHFEPAPMWHTWALSDHYQSGFHGGARSRTYLGELIYRAKYLHDRAALDQLDSAVRHCTLQLKNMPPHVKDGFATITAVAAVPCNPPKPVSVPNLIAAAAATALGVPDVSATIVKIHPTDPAKLHAGLHRNVYQVQTLRPGSSVLIVDDVLRTGATLESVAGHLRTAGATHLVGMCVTKAHQGMAI